jgi:predicted deacylase
MVELSGQYGFTAQEIRRGQSVIRNYLRALGMLSGVLRRLSRRLIWVDQAEKMDVNAPVPGVFVPRDIPLGALIEEGTLLGEIVSHQTLARTAVRAARTGWLFRYGCMHEQEPEHVRPFEHAFVRLGETIATLAWASDG